MLTDTMMFCASEKILEPVTFKKWCREEQSVGEKKPF
jgi:hypothetical protein